MIYLAAPYTHSDPQVVEERMKLFCIADARLCKMGHVTVSPLSKHWLGQYSNIPLSWDFWKSYSETLMNSCTELVVITLDGWETSTGVQAEIKLALERNLPISYVKVNADNTISVTVNM